MPDGWLHPLLYLAAAMVDTGYDERQAEVLNEYLDNNHGST